MTPTTPPVKRPALHHLIALTGHAGAGKDTTADLLVAHGRFRKLAFADALRGEVSNAFSVSLDDLNAPHLKNVATVALRMRLAPRDFLAAVVLSLSAASPSGGTGLHLTFDACACCGLRLFMTRVHTSDVEVVETKAVEGT